MTDTGLDLFADDTDRPARAAQRCKVGKLLEAATPRSRELLLERLHSDPFAPDGWTDAQLCQAIGRRVSSKLLAQHRGEVCVCDPHPAREGIDR